MFPKEHGAWNGLLIALAAGWIALGHWTIAAQALSVLWVSAFLIRGPWNQFRQYRGSDHIKRRRALALLAVLGSIILIGLLTAVALVPDPCRWLLVRFGLPLGSVLMVLTVLNRSLRFPLAEVLGFLGVTVLVPLTYLCDPAHPLLTAFWLWGLFGGYFLLGLALVKVRQKWLERSRKGLDLSPAERFSQAWWVILVAALWVEGLGDLSGGRLLLMAAPLYAFLKTLVGLVWGRSNMPMMRLGLREMAHSMVFTSIWAWAWLVSSH